MERRKLPAKVVEARETHGEELQTDPAEGEPGCTEARRENKEGIPEDGHADQLKRSCLTQTPTSQKEKESK